MTHNTFYTQSGAKVIYFSSIYKFLGEYFQNNHIFGSLEDGFAYSLEVRGEDYFLKQKYAL